MKRWDDLRDRSLALKDKFEKVKERQAKLEAAKGEKAQIDAQLEALTSSRKENGPYKARPRGDVIIPGKYHFIDDGVKSFATYDDAWAFLKDIGSTEDGRYILRDADGNDVKSPPLKVPVEKLKALERQLSLARRGVADLSDAYDEIASEYQSEQTKLDVEMELVQESVRAFSTGESAGTSDGATLVMLDDGPKDRSKFPFAVSEIPSEYLGKVEGNGNCAVFVQKVAKLPEAKYWRAGEAVKENANIPAGTPIATFDSKGEYPNKDKGNHVCIYLSQTKDGIWCVDQYRNPDGTKKPVGKRMLWFRPSGYSKSPSNNGNAYSIVTVPQAISDQR